MILVTGGADFIGSNFVMSWLAEADEPVLNLDKLTYAGNLENLASLQGDARHIFVRGDLGERNLVDRLFVTMRWTPLHNRRVNASGGKVFRNFTNMGRSVNGHLSSRY
jgi:dTDP-D-glucose 4,6-dehydratase